MAQLLEAHATASGIASPRPGPHVVEIKKQLQKAVLGALHARVCTDNYSNCLGLWPTKDFLGRTNFFF